MIGPAAAAGRPFNRYLRRIRIFVKSRIVAERIMVPPVRVFKRVQNSYHITQNPKRCPVGTRRKLVSGQQSRLRTAGLVAVYTVSKICYCGISVDYILSRCSTCCPRVGKPQIIPPDFVHPVEIFGRGYYKIDQFAKFIRFAVFVILNSVGFLSQQLQV